MKNIFFYVSLISFLLLSCTTGNKFSTTTEDKALLSAIKKLDKNPLNEELKNTLTSLYDQSAKSHLDKIEIYNTLTEPDRWMKIIREYEALKNLSEIISKSSVAKFISPSSYISEIQNAKQNGAEAYYNIGTANLKNDDKQSARNAYYAFKKANEFVPGYKDVRQQISIAYQNSVVKVIINPVRDNTFFYNSMGWNNYGNNINNDYFQRSLVNDLGGSFNKISPALFYTDWEARRENIQPDWVVDLTWINLNIPQPMSTQYSRNISRQIERSRDSSGKVQYETVNATLYIIKKYFTASGDMELRITDVNTGKNITNNRYNEQYNWQEEYATYSGDSKALSGNDYSLLNNNNFQIPHNDNIVTELSRRIYPQIKNRIATVVNW